MKHLQTLYHKGKNGELRQWRVFTENDTVFTEHGLVDGALQISSKKCTPKNVGKKNATTAQTQAIAEAESMFTFKLERKYALSPEEAQLPLLLPMLAGKYDAKKHNGYFYCQPKLDGVRCIARWEGDCVVLYSRQGKVYDVKHISDQLKDVLGKDDVFDGEIYIHGMSLQSMISLVKKPQSDSLLLEYHIYDYPVINGNEDYSTEERLTSLSKINVANKNNLKIVSGQELGCDKHSIGLWQSKYLASGYEGLMLREKDSKYLWGYRSNDLLKVKTFQDAEFEIVDVIEGEGKMVGHGIMICKNDLSDATFKVVPKTTMEVRKEIFDNKSNYIGKKYTVKYFDRTEDLIPRFPVGIAVRDYE
jgi:DNA ligase-1